MSRILFPDLSDYEAEVDLLKLTRWQRAQFGISLVVLKATESIDYVSPRFKARWQRLDHLAEVRGAYHFAHVGENPPKTEADHFFNVIHDAGLRRSKGKADVVMLDAEFGHLAPRPSRVWMGTFLAHLDARAHAAASLRPAWIYGGDWFRQHCSPGPIERYFWLSAYVDDPAPFWPQQIGQASLRVAWQFTDGKLGPGPHTIPGVGSSDLSYFLGDAHRLRSVAGVL